MRELEQLGLTPTGRGAWHGTTVTSTPSRFGGNDIEQVWTVSAVIDDDAPNPLRRFGVLVRHADDLGDYSRRFVACKCDLPLLVGEALRDPYSVTAVRA